MAQAVEVELVMQAEQGLARPNRIKLRRDNSPDQQELELCELRNRREDSRQGQRVS